MWNKKVIIVYVCILALCASCRQSCFEVLTQNNVAYWSLDWTLHNPYGAIMEYSKKDSTLKYLDDSWIYENWNHAFWGLKFRISNDTLFEYVNRKGRIITYDSLPIVTYSKNKIVIKNKESEQVTWHRLPTKFAKRAIDIMNTPGQVKLSSILIGPLQKMPITDIADVTWKLYGYGEVSTGLVQKSETLKHGWENLVRFCKDGNLIGFTTANEFQGTYGISNSCIHITDFRSSNQKEDYDGGILCETLPQRKRFRMIGNWLQLFYDEGEKFLLFKVSNTTQLDVRGFKSN